MYTRGYYRPAEHLKDLILDWWEGMIAIGGRSPPFLRKHTFSAILEKKIKRGAQKENKIGIWT